MFLKGILYALYNNKLVKYYPKTLAEQVLIEPKSTITLIDRLKDMKNGVIINDPDDAVDSGQTYIITNSNKMPSISNYTIVPVKYDEDSIYQQAICIETQEKIERWLVDGQWSDWSPISSDGLSLATATVKCVIDENNSYMFKNPISNFNEETQSISAVIINTSYVTPDKFTVSAGYVKLHETENPVDKDDDVYVVLHQLVKDGGVTYNFNGSKIAPKTITHDKIADTAFMTGQEVIDNTGDGKIVGKEALNKKGELLIKEADDYINSEMFKEVDILGEKRLINITDSNYINFARNEKIEGKSVQNLFNINNMDTIYEEEHKRIIIYEDRHIRKTGTYTFTNVSDKNIKFVFRNTDTTETSWIYNKGTKPVIKPGEMLVIETKDNYGIATCEGFFSDGWENTDVSKAELKQSLLILEGDWIDKDIPTSYFSGIQSVQNTSIKINGKNLIDESLLNTDGISLNDILKENKEYTVSSFGNTTYIKIATDRDSSGDDILIHGNDSITFTMDYDKQWKLYVWHGDTDGSRIYPSMGNFHVQLEEGSSKTDYEPYMKSEQNIVEPLRSIGDVHDELDIDKGIITRRAIEYNTNAYSSISYDINLYGDDYYNDTSVQGQRTDTVRIICTFNIDYNVKKISRNTPDREIYNVKSISDKYDIINHNKLINLEEENLCCIIHDDNILQIQIVVPNSKLAITSVSDSDAETKIKTWVANNPITVLCELEEPVIEKVNVNPLKLFKGTNNLSINSNIIPRVSFEYPIITGKVLEGVIDIVYKYTKERIITSNPNLLINSNFINPVNQRFNNDDFVLPNDDQYKFYIDRWKFQNRTKGNITLNTKSKSLKIKIDTDEKKHANDIVLLSIIQHFEHDTVLFNNCTYNISIKYKQSEAGMLSTGISERVYSNNIVNEWQILSVTGTCHIVKTMYNPYIWIDIHKKGTIEIEYIKLELGNKATPFVPRPYGEELALCQRYYIHFLTGLEINKYIDEITYVSYLPGSMRVTPTIKSARIFENSSAEITGFTLNDIKMTQNAFRVKMKKASHGLMNTQTHLDISAIDAEIY